MVSKFGHCLNDLLFRWRSGSLPVDIVGVVSNHRDFEDLVGTYSIPFHYIPVTAETKADAERELIDLVDAESVDLVVLARYMQVLSDDLCKSLEGKVINIHHSFLPSFKGAKPYHQAHQRGVKLIGATAHYVTGDLDEGPIIEQEVQRVGHDLSPERLAAVGRDTEWRAPGRGKVYEIHKIVDWIAFFVESSNIDEEYVTLNGRTLDRSQRREARAQIGELLVDVFFSHLSGRDLNDDRIKGGEIELGAYVDLDAEVQALAIFDAGDLNLRAAHGANTGLTHCLGVGLGQVGVDGLFEHSATADALVDDARGDLALAETGDAHRCADGLIGLIEARGKVLKRHLHVQLHAGR
jgi:folate-dependent phosphoribosylglycinamide formyltransferase PurN